MRLLANKQIPLISPQNRGTLFVSKQHYAIELAKRGNTVYFYARLRYPGQVKRRALLSAIGYPRNVLFIIL